MTILAFDIGGSTIKFGLFDQAAFQQKCADQADSESVPLTDTDITPLTGFQQLPIPQNWDDFVKELQNIIQACAGHVPKGAALKIGISVAGVKDPFTAKMMSGNIPAIHGHCLERELSDILGVPVICANDAQCFVLHESLYVRQSSNALVFGIILGTGVGGGLVLNKQLVSGAHGFCGEWGHGNNLTAVSLSYGLSSHQCGCGKADCLDVYGSARGLERIYAQITDIQSDAITILSKWEQSKLQPTPLSSENQGIQKAIDCYLGIVGPQLVTMVNLLDPVAIPVGGGLGQNHALVGALDAYVANQNLANQQGYGRTGLIRPAMSSKNGGVLGAAALASSRGNAV